MFTSSKTALDTALKLSTDIVERRNTIPILSNALLMQGADGDASRLYLRMSDMDVQATVTFPAEVAAGFHAFTLPAHMLREIVKKLPDGTDIRLDKTETGVTIKSGRSKFSLATLPEHDFPSLDAGETPCQMVLDAKALAEAMAAISFAISTEETRYYLNGIYLHAEGDGVMLVATDGHRLAKRFLRLISGAGPEDGFIIPTKTVKVMLKILPKDGEVSIEASTNKVVVDVPGTQLTSKLIDGTFPDYRRIIPAEGSPLVSLDAQALMKAIDRVSTVSTERGRGAKFTFAGGELRLSVSNPDAGQAEETMTYDGDLALETGFNAKYVLDIVTHLPEGDITLAIADPGSPAIFRADGDHKQNLIVLMPMRV